MTRYEKFTKHVKEWVESLKGISIHPDAFHYYSIDTIYGNFDFSVKTEPNDILYTVFGRFSDIVRARALRGVNPYSGKWNHHYSVRGADKISPLEAFELFKNELMAIL